MKEKLRPVEFDADVAVQALKDYCANKGYDVRQIDRYQRAWDIFAALKYNDVEPNGLCNDMETLPDVVLYYTIDGVVHETEHTQKIAIGG